MALVVGLDIGSKTITGAVISGTPKKFRLVDFFVEEVPDLDLSAGGALSTETVDLDSGGDLPIGVAEVVRRILTERHLENADVVASLPTKNCILREFWVPFVRDDQIRKTLPFEAENSLITFDVEDMILEYHKVAESEGKSQLVLFAARSQAIRDRLELLGDAGVDPVALDLDAAALFNAYALTPTFDAQRTTLLIDMGASTTNVLLIQDGELKKVRAIRMDTFLGPFGGRRQLPQGAAEAASSAGEGRLGFEFPDASSIEARFDEIESALRRIDPYGSESGGSESGGSDEPVEEAASAAGDTGNDDPGLEDPGLEDPGLEDPGLEDPGLEDLADPDLHRPRPEPGSPPDRFGGPGLPSGPSHPARERGPEDAREHEHRDLEAGAMAAAGHEEEEPIAILTDEEYERVAAEAENAGGPGRFDPGTGAVVAAEEDLDGGAGGVEGSDEDDLGAETFARERASVVETAEEHFAQVQEGPGRGANGANGTAPSFRQYLERLGLEIQRTFASNFIRSPVELVCLTGGMSQQEEAKRFFRSELDIETISLDFGDSFEADIQEEQRESLNRLGAVAVGLAVKEQGHDRVGFDFRKGPFRYERRFDKLKYPLLLTGVMLCALFLQLVFDLISQYQFWQQRANAVRTREQDYYDAFWGDLGENSRQAPLLADASIRLKSKLENLLGKGGGDIPVLMDDIEALVQIGEVFRQATLRNVRFKITQIDLNLTTRASSAGRGKGKGPQLSASGTSQIMVDLEDPGDVPTLRKLFDASQMWDASPSQSGGQGQVKATFKLTPKESYLRTLSN